MKRYFEIAGVRHECKGGPYVLHKDAVALETYSEMLEQENAKLKAQIENTRLGLEKMEKLITKDYWLYPGTNNEGDLVSLGLMDPTGWEEHLSGKTLADLIGKIALKES